MKTIRFFFVFSALAVFLAGCELLPENTEPITGTDFSVIETAAPTRFPGWDPTDSSEPAATDPPATETQAAVPTVTVPPATEPTVTEPPVTEPTVTIPPVTEPAVTEPPVTEPPAPTAHTHQWGAWETRKPAGCETEGVRLRICSTCGTGEKESIPAVGHSWDSGKENATDSTCGGGEKIYTCLHCGATKSEALPASHTFGDWAYEEYTYTIYYEPGSLEYVHGGPSSTHTSHRQVRVCTQCGSKEYGNTPDHPCKRGSVNHTVTTIREVTCQQRGLKRSTCKICGWYVEYEYGNDDDGHAWVSEERHLTDYTETTDYLDVEILTCTACGKVLYYYRWGDGPCICGRTPCVAEGNWRSCKSICRSAYMYDNIDVGINSRSFLYNQGDSYYVNTSDNRFNYNPDGYITHPTWQTVTRNYIFNEEGKVIQFTVIWHDESGTKFSDIVYVPDIPQLFLDADFDPELVNYPYAHFHLTPLRGKLEPTSISYSG